MENKSTTAARSNVYLNDEARAGLMRGVDAVADAVKLTLGAGGANAVLEAGVQPGHLITNDGVSIAMQVKLEDPIENIGANLVKEIASRSDKESGDGTTTSTVLAQAILHAGDGVEASPMDIKRSLDECLPILNLALDEQTRPITVDEVAGVASVSAESEYLGSLFQEMYQEIGKDGLVELDFSNLPETFYELSEGVRLRNAGWLGAYSSTEPGKAVFKQARILITKQKVSTVDELDPILKAVAQEGKRELVLFVDEIDMGVASRLAATHLQGGFKTLIIKAPTLWKDWLFEDFAKITGATIIDEVAGTSLKKFSLSYLGSAERIITTKDETRVIGIKDVSEHIAELNSRGDDEGKLRAAWLQTKVATLKLGASSESELSYVRLKAEDARNAAYLALQDGIVPGGGVALMNASFALPETVGGRILRAALRAPMRQIIENAGGAYKEPECSEDIGFNARTGEWVNMWDAGIVDPVRVVKNAIKNAISVAGTVLTTKVAITLPKEDEAPRPMPGM